MPGIYEITAELLGLQQELPGAFTAEASHVGNRGTRLGISRNFSYTPANDSWYHSLQTRLERRFTLQAACIWSKAMDATSFMNASDPCPTSPSATSTALIA